MDVKPIANWAGWTGAGVAELVIRSTDAGRFITAAGRVISRCRSDYYGTDSFIPVGLVSLSRRRRAVTDQPLAPRGNLQNTRH